MTPQEIELEDYNNAFAAIVTFADERLKCLHIANTEHNSVITDLRMYLSDVSNDLTVHLRVEVEEQQQREGENERRDLRRDYERSVL